MDQPEKFLSHFGVPGMKWGRRAAARYDKKIGRAMKKAEKFDAKGNKTAANRHRDAASLYKNRKQNVKRVAKIGESVRKGTTFVDKLLGTDKNLMTMRLSKGKYTSGEIAVANILNGSSATMNSRIRETIVNG